MSVDLIRYDLLVQDALRAVVRRVLTDVARDGLPGDHHLYVSFDTTAPGVRLSPRLKERYPEEMTIVLQHQFWDLIVTEPYFEVGLSFNGIPERLHVPFDSLKGFFDPSVKFGLQFEPTSAEDDEEEEVEPVSSQPTPITSPRPTSVPSMRAPSAGAPKAVPAAKATPSAAGSAKPELAKAAKPDAIKPEPTKSDAAKADAAKPEALRAVPSRPAPVAKPADGKGTDGKGTVGKGADPKPVAAKPGDAEPAPAKSSEPDAAEGENKGAQVVRLDAFRKK
ncbi:hypothetical protein KIP89_18750 [Ancylobacter sp. VKM B-3255]|uniref:Stringent starvation protein B n=1 Tax=Ancylobacter radicis TaxID=2836179 RepID=A0ABS5RBW7_9HYPH|nr:hypothetical protein [Ancylobacter radicis]